MAVIVQKFGGTSVANVDKIRHVADKVVATHLAGNQVVVVVSAMAKATDSLLQLAYEAATIDGSPAAPARRELDMLVTTGERVSMALLSLAIHARGADAISFTGSQCGILTNDRHFDARIIEVRPHRVEDELARGKIVIVAGYQGVSYTREITTLGRGGSDTTAVALAAALNADRCEIYSDVDGVYSADPRVVPNAKHIPQLDPELLQEMAESGAKVLNAHAVEWARRHGIAIYARSTFAQTNHVNSERDPKHVPERETVVRRFAPRDDNRVRAVTCENNVALVRLITGAPGDLARIASGLRSIDLPFRDLNISSQGGSFIVPLTNVPDWEQRKSIIAQTAPWDSAKIDTGVSVVSIVGYGLTENAEPMLKLVEHLNAANIEPLQSHASPMRLSATIDAIHTGSAQRTLHHAFVEET